MVNHLFEVINDDVILYDLSFDEELKSNTEDEIASSLINEIKNYIINKEKI